MLSEECKFILLGKHALTNVQIIPFTIEIVILISLVIDVKLSKKLLLSVHAASRK